VSSPFAELGLSPTLVRAVAAGDRFESTLGVHVDAPVRRQL